MTKYDILTIGHISLDYNIDYKDNLIIEIGGAVVYSSAAAYALGHRVAALTKLSKTDAERKNGIIIPEKDVFCLPSQKSTSIQNKYYTADKERRDCLCKSQGDPFTFDEIKNFDAGVYHFAGLIYGDFSGELIKKVSKLGKTAVDVQALLRHADKESGKMYFEDWQEKKEIMPYIYYLKTDAAEAEILTGQSDRYKAAEIFYEWGAKEVVITHNTEVIAYNGDEIYSCPIKARNLSGRSGRGDTTFAAYISERKNSGVKKALLYAAATVSAKMEKPGAYGGTRADIESYIGEFYKKEAAEIL